MDDPNEVVVLDRTDRTASVELRSVPGFVYHVELNEHYHLVAFRIEAVGDRSIGTREMRVAPQRILRALSRARAQVDARSDR